MSTLDTCTLPKTNARLLLLIKYIKQKCKQGQFFIYVLIITYLLDTIVFQLT
jgi:hypothetical protein